MKWHDLKFGSWSKTTRYKREKFIQFSDSCEGHQFPVLVYNDFNEWQFLQQWCLLSFFTFRHLGYVVDLEDRRGKDEQRVDEGLHLFIYKVKQKPFRYKFKSISFCHDIIYNDRNTDTTLDGYLQDTENKVNSCKFLYV